MKQIFLTSVLLQICGSNKRAPVLVDKILSNDLRVMRKKLPSYLFSVEKNT